MEIKALEIRDAATFIPALAIRMVPRRYLDECGTEIYNSEHWLLRRAGFNFDNPCVILCRMEASGCDRNATYDPYSWGRARTMQVAHLHILEHWKELKSGDVIDVEYILGERSDPKTSERLDAEERLK